MSIFNNGNFAKPFNVSQPQLNSSDRTANLRSKTKYASAVNLAKNGGVLTKRDGSKYVGPVHTTSATMTSADSYSDLLDVTKGKYLLTPPPSSNLDTSFSPASGDVFYGSFTVTDYAEANIPVTMLGAPGVTTSPAPTKYDDPNKLVVPVAPASAPPPFNNTSIVVDPEYRMFYGKKTCGMRDYFKNVRIDPSADVRWTADGVVHSSRPYNQQQAQRILAHEAQRLRGFQYPARVHLDLDNCESKPSITPVAPDAPVIYISSQTLTSDEPELFTVTVAWPHGFDGGSPITSYTVYTSTGTGESYTVDPQPCLNSYTLTNVALTTQIWVTATNCIPQSSWPSGTPAPHCTPTTSDKSNPVNPAPPHLPTITIAFSSGPNPMPYEPNKVITMTITSDNPMPFSVTSSQLDNGLAQLNQPNGGSGTRALTTTNSYSITLVSGKNPTVPRTTISVSFMQASGGGYSRGFATANLVILPALPPQIVFKLNGSSATTLTVPYSPQLTIPMTISSNYPVLQSTYQVQINYSSTDSGYAQITSGNAGIQLLKTPSTPTVVTITVKQPGTANYPEGTATKTLTITPAAPPTITIGLPSSTVQYVPNATILMSITSTSNPPLAQSEYHVSSSNTNLVEITSGNAGIQLLPNANSTSNQQVTITVLQPLTSNYPSGTATKTLTITPAPPPTVTLTFNPASSVTYEPGKIIGLNISSTQPLTQNLAAAGGLFTLQGPGSGMVIVSANELNNFIAGQILTATATAGSGSFGGARVTVTNASIQSGSLAGVQGNFPTVSVSIVGGTPVEGNISNIMSLTLYNVSSTSDLVKINPPTSGYSDYTVALLRNPSAPSQPVTITVIQPGTSNYPSGTGTATLTIQPIQMPQKNFTGWLPSGLTSQQPDFMTQEIGSLGTATTGTPFHVMGFNTGGNYTLSRYNQGATLLTTLLTGSGSITSINEQLITNPSMSGGSRNLIVCGNFQSATIPTTSTTTRVNNIFQYNVDTQAVIPLQCATTSPTYPVGTNDQVWGCEVDTANNRVWVWGDFYYAGTNSQGQTIVPLSDVALCSGSDFVTSANWTAPVSWQGISGYRGCRGGKVLDSTASYSLMVWASEISNLSTPPTFSAFNAVGMVYNSTNPGWGWCPCIANCFLSGDGITQAVSKIQFIQNAGGSGYKIFLTGSFNNATVSGSGVAVCSSIVYANGGYQVDPTTGLYGDTLYQAFGSANTSFWVNNGVQISVSNLRQLTNDVLLMTTNGYVNGGILTVPISSLTTLPTKWGGFTAPYSANYIGGTDPNSVKLITNLNANPFYYSQTFNMT